MGHFMELSRLYFLAYSDSAVNTEWFRNPIWCENRIMNLLLDEQ